jgi:hypothetical protein
LDRKDKEREEERRPGERRGRERKGSKEREEASKDRGDPEKNLEVREKRLGGGERKRKEIRCLGNVLLLCC